MEILIHSLILIACLGGLWVGANWLVDTASLIARRIGFSEAVIGLTIVAIGTSAPEFAVSALAALKEHASISVGNVVGSNVFNLGLILGGVAMIRPIRSDSALVYRDGGVLMLAALLLLFFFRDLQLASWEGAFLGATLTGYIAYLLYTKAPPGEDVPDGEFQWYHPLQLMVGLAVILVSSHFLVDSASFIARSFGVSEWVIGVTIIAAGTSTPELVTSLAAALKGRHALLAGNLVGSDLFNLLGVLGMAAILKPMVIESVTYQSLWMLLGSLVLVALTLRTGWKISRFEGLILVLIGLFRWGIDIFR